MPLLDRSGLVRDAVQAGAVVPCDAAADAVLREAEGVGCLAITVPATGDGRVFSLAAMLRERGWTGTIRAVGPLIPDQFAFALACGIDQVEITDEHLGRQPVGQWLAALDVVSRAYVGTDGIFARRAARASCPAPMP